MKRLLILLIATLPIHVLAQGDSLKTKRLEEVIVKGKALYEPILSCLAIAIAYIL